MCRIRKVTAAHVIDSIHVEVKKKTRHCTQSVSIVKRKRNFEAAHVFLSKKNIDSSYQAGSNFKVILRRRTASCTIPAGIRRRLDVEIWLKIGWQRRQRDINVILTSLCERWFNISIQTSKQCRYGVRRFDLKFRRCFNVGLTFTFG